MPVTADTIAAQRRMRIHLEDIIEQTTRDLAQAWGRAWDEIADEWAEAIAELTADGVWPTAAQIARARTAQAALHVTADALDDLAQQAGVRILSDATALAADAALWVEAVARTQLPDGVWVGFNRTDPAAIRAIVARTTQQITARTRPLSAEATAAMKSALIRGVAVGDNPEQAARIMLARAEQGFNGGLHRARTIARTEMLDAHRAAARASRAANSDIMTAWQWWAELSSRTCPACLAMHGTTHPATESGPNGHPCCRCTSLPVTKTWAELGFDLPEPAGAPAESGEEWLRAQPVEVQKAILGKRGWEKWFSGDWPASEWAVTRQNPGWRPSIVAAPPPA